MIGLIPTWRGPFVGINRFEAFVKENVPYGNINIRPRSSSDVNSNPKQTQQSNRAHNQKNIGLNAVA